MTQPDNDKDLEKVRRTRTSTVWTLTSVAAILLLLLVIFVAQNGQQTRIHFLGASGSTSVAVGLLLSAVTGALIVLLVGALRIAQLRLATRRHLRGTNHAYPAEKSEQSETSGSKRS